MIKKYNNFKINEKNSHWTEEINIEYDKIDYFKNVLADLTDIGFEIKIYGIVLDSNFSSSIGSKSKYLSGLNLYKGYIIRLVYSNNSNRISLEKLIEIKENEIYIIEGLKKLGFRFSYINQYDDILITIYHPDDIIKIDDYIQNSPIHYLKINIDNDVEYFKKLIGKLCEISNSSSNIIFKQNPYYYDKYSLDDIYNIINKICKRKYINKKYTLRKENDTILLAGLPWDGV